MSQRIYKEAYNFLKNDFILPNEIITACDLLYSQPQKHHFANTLPNEDTLRWCKNNDYVLVAGPPKTLSLVDICDLEPELLSEMMGIWCLNQTLKPSFAQEDKVTGGEWLAIRKGIVPHSNGKLWSDQRTHLSNKEYIPNIAEVAWAFLIFKKVKGVYLSHKYAQTSSLDKNNLNLLCASFVGDTKFCIFDFLLGWDGSETSEGVLSALKLK